jgi:hypothetical protein
MRRPFCIADWTRRTRLARNRRGAGPKFTIRANQAARAPARREPRTRYSAVSRRVGGPCRGKLQPNESRVSCRRDPATGGAASGSSGRVLP